MEKGRRLHKKKYFPLCPFEEYGQLALLQLRIIESCALKIKKVLKFTDLTLELKTPFDIVCCKPLLKN